jgi:hypothetical protein
MASSTITSKFALWHSANQNAGTIACRVVTAVPGGPVVKRIRGPVVLHPLAPSAPPAASAPPAPPAPPAEGPPALPAFPARLTLLAPSAWLALPALLALLAPIVVPTPAAAGVVIVPLASNVTLAGAQYSTKVWVSNPDPAPRHFTTLFIAQGTDGTTQQTTSGDNVVPARGTLVLKAAPQGQSGLLEIGGAPSLEVSAVLEVRSSDGTLLGGATIPAITQSNALAAGSALVLSGLQRGHGILTDLSLINLDGAAAQCTVSAFRADGSQIASAAVLSMLPLSRRDFLDALAILGESALADASFLATCDHAFYAYASVYQPGGAAVQFVGPAGALAGSVGPGLPGGGPSGGTNVTFTVPGTFLNATPSNSEAYYELPAPAGVAFKRATIEWDMHIGTFPGGLFTGVVSFRRPNKVRGLREPFCAVQIVNRNSKTLLDLGIENVLVRTVGPWKANGSYHQKLTYDLTVNQCELDVSQGGAVIYTIAGPAQWFDLSANGNPLVVDFGQTGIGDGAYFPPVTWSFSNLDVVLEPK